MVDESIDHENDPICNAMHAVLVLGIWQRKMKQILLKKKKGFVLL